ncbi:putative nucleoside-diphosphate-sugar epimerase [Xylariaceae sp. FL0594]|nr:putative nucleoside-diphosphate-sugar epimerase [Xylariaceae sp. FL0594]
MHLILTGATGLVGSGVLDAMLKAKGVTKISILSRRPVAMAEDAKDARVNVILHKDFTNYDSAVLEQLKGARGCVWALGISQTQASKEDYVRITKDYALAASQAFQKLAHENEPFNFVYVSGHGATTEPGRFAAIFARVKGETEVALAALRRQNPWLHAMSVRPAAVDGSAHEAIKRYLPTPPILIRMLGSVLLTPIRVGLPSLHSPTEELGRVLTELAMGRHVLTPGKDIATIGEFPILENSALRRLAALST